MPVDDDVHAALAGLSDVTAHVSDRIWDRLPDNYKITEACLVIEDISDPPTQTLDHAIVWCDARYQIDIWAPTKPEAKEIREHLKTGFHDYAGGCIKKVQYQGGPTFYDSFQRAYHLPTDFIVTYK